MRLYKTGILGGFKVSVITIYYCSDVWHFWSKRSKDKLEQLNKQALRMVKPLDNGHLSDVV